MHGLRSLRRDISRECFAPSAPGLGVQMAPHTAEPAATWVAQMRGDGCAERSCSIVMPVDTIKQKGPKVASGRPFHRRQ